jgi:hypothetical protein
VLARFEVTGGGGVPDDCAARKPEILQKIRALEAELAALRALVEGLN